MIDFIAALGLAMAIEGIAYALAPNGMRRMMLNVLEQPTSTVRYAGLFLAVIGVVVVYVARG